ncbi:MAG TPA: pyridoxal-phosphate dependent enzyme [Chloroflexota bacterium]|jgi:threonine dehydratase|nr:pyridoxal-phosphate dependent enzyme [Chloroflexota bacterium]
MATLTAKHLEHGEPAELTPPDFSDILAARRRILGHVERTSSRNYPAIDRLAGVEVWVKHENFQVTGAFKIRGGINLVSRLTEGERARGVIAASTGNHGLSVVTAAQRFGVAATICVPEAANPSKVAAIRGTGAKVVHHGVDFNEAVDHAESLATEHSLRYIHSGDEPLLIAGVATMTLEIFEGPAGRRPGPGSGRRWIRGCRRDHRTR